MPLVLLLAVKLSFDVVREIGGSRRLWFEARAKLVGITLVGTLLLLAVFPVRESCGRLISFYWRNWFRFGLICIGVLFALAVQMIATIGWHESAHFLLLLLPLVRPR